MKRSAVLAAMFLLAGCATSTIHSDGSPLRHPLCDATDQRSSISLLWSPNPKLVIGIPTLIEGGTEMLLETRVIDQRSATSLASSRTHWKKGGPFCINGVKTLDADMRTVLAAIFAGSGEEP